MRVVIVAGTVLLLSAPLSAMFVNVPAERVREVPVDRILLNLERNPEQLSSAALARALGRVHLIAFLRDTPTLPVFEKAPTRVVERGVVRCPGPLVTTDPGLLCHEPDYTLEPPQETPPLDRRGAASDPHLQAAIRYYTEARRLQPYNLRTGVALAFAYDASGQREQAVRELRQLLAQGYRRSPDRRDVDDADALWSRHVVLSEAVAHMRAIASTPADKELAARVDRELDTNPPPRAITPVLVPLRPSYSPEELVDRRSPVAFDFSGQGLPMRGGWLTADAAWLVWNPAVARDITSGFQLFGSVTWMAFWDTGYDALSTLDDDGNGELSGTEMAGLALWRDTNGDGLSQPDEVQSVDAYDIVAIGYRHKRMNREFWTSQHGVRFADGEERPTYDWLLTERARVSRTH